MKREMKRLHIICLALVILVVSVPPNIHPEPITTMAQTSCVPPPSSLVSWWPGDGDPNDLAGSNDGILQNGTTFTTGMVGQGFSPDGIDDFVRVPHNANLNPGTGDFTVDFWMKTTSSGVERAVLSKRPFCGYTSFWSIGMTAPGCCFIPGVQDGHLLFEINQDGPSNYVQILSTVAVNDGNWHHIALVRNGTTLTAYIDQAVQGSKSISVIPNSANTTNLLFGSDPCGRRKYLGELDEIEYFNRALSQAEIEAIYDAGSAGKCKDCYPDQTAPVGSCPADTTRSANVNCQAAIPNVLADVSASDNCTLSASLTMSQSLAVGMQVGLGVHPITVSVRDVVGNSSTCGTNNSRSGYDTAGNHLPAESGGNCKSCHPHRQHECWNGDGFGQLPESGRRHGHAQ